MKFFIISFNYNSSLHFYYYNFQISAGKNNLLHYLPNYVKDYYKNHPDYIILGKSITCQYLVNATHHAFTCFNLFYRYKENQIDII